MTIEPVYTPSELDEMVGLDYLLLRLEEFRNRGLIAAESFQTVIAESQARRQTIERAGGFAAALAQARALAKVEPREALAWAERAREIDPAQVEPWELLVALEWAMDEDDEAILRCEEAARRFPALQSELDRLRGERQGRAEARRRSLEQSRRHNDVNQWLAQARHALENHRDVDTIALCRQVLLVVPGHTDALAMAAFAHQRRGELDQALEMYEALERAQPHHKAWSLWARNIRLRRGAQRITRPTADSAAAPRLRAEPAAAPDGVGAIVSPNLSWSSFTGEFLQEHWQKLILCLAVLLIVVSSTVGAHLLLGDLLWSPVGKCALALVATLLFALLGAGLVRWGAGRAGRMMLIATLIVVPIHFMLAGELRLLLEPLSPRHLFLALDALALIALVRWVSGMLARPAGARFLTIALLLLSIGSAATTRGSPIAWSLQFASFQLSPLVFLASVWILGARRWGSSSREQLDFVYMMLGLLGFALVSCLFRTGYYALRLETSLYALPLMVGAISCVHTARRLVPYESDAQRLALMRLGGYALSGLAFALVLAGNAVPSALGSGNSLAVAVLGLILYATSLRDDRHPAFLYMALGAVVAGRYGAHYFLADRLHAIEESVRQLLGYPDHLPRSFRAILGLLPNTALAWLALWFIKNWDDRRLARHCHYIGVPLSIAACVWSGFEPLAAVICLSGYAVLYLWAVWAFAAPAVTYLAVAAIGGASYFASTRLPSVTLADQSLIAAAIGSGCWAASALLRRLRVAEAYRVPWFRAAAASIPVVLFAVTPHLMVAGIDSASAAAALALITALALFLNHESPHAVWPHVAFVSFLELSLCALGQATAGKTLPAHDFALLFMADGLIVLALAEALRMTVRTAARLNAGATGPPWAVTILAAVPRAAIVLSALAVWVDLYDVERTWISGVVWLLASAALLWTTRLNGSRTLVYVGLAFLAIGTFDLSTWTIGWGHPAKLAGWLAVAAAMLALVLWAAAAAGRRIRLAELYTGPCMNVACALTLIAFAGALDARFLGRAAYPHAVAALALNSVATMLIAWSWRAAGLTYAAVVHLVTATYVVIFSVGNNDPLMAYVLGLAAVTEALLLWTIGFGCQRARDAWTSACADPLYNSSLLLTALAIPLADRSPVVLALVGLSFLLAVKSRPRIEWVYAAIGSLGAAAYLRWLSHSPRIELIAVAAIAAFGLWTLGVSIQRHRPSLCRRLGLSPLAYEFSMFHSSIAVALISVLLRVDLSVQENVAWTAHGWLPLGLAFLCMGMLRAYPRRAWVHMSLAFLSWCVVAAIVPSLTAVCWLTLVGIALALAFLVIERVIRPIEPRICARLGVIEAGYGSVVRNWASAIFAVATGLAMLVMAEQMAWAIAGLRPMRLALSAFDWWIMLAALGLFGAFLATAGTDPEGWSRMEPQHELIALHWLSVAALWWLGVRCSPLTGQAVTAAVYYPLATAIAALGTAQLFQRSTLYLSWHEPGWLGDLATGEWARMLSVSACLLAALAVLFTKGAEQPATVLTLILASVTLLLVALGSGWDGAAFFGSLAWTSAWCFAALIAARLWGWHATRPRLTFAALGALLATFVLWGLAGRLRRDGAPDKQRIAGDSGSSPSFMSRLARAVEVAAFATALLAGAAVLMAGADALAVPGWETAVGVAVLMGAALLQILLVPRWQAEWLVYLAQTTMLAAYVLYRWAFPQPIATDAAILTGLGYLDLGISEVLERFDRRNFVRPTRYFSFVLPVLPLFQLIGIRGIDDVSLFYLLSAATFYGVAFGQLRWKPLSYAAGVFYNAALWVLWSQLRWTISDHFQFFVVPVGLSTILFAQVNRRDLSRQTVNTIRSAGLMIVYVALAVPIWQFESFGAWAVLLVGSLVGILLGIGMRLQTFLWMGLATFVLDVIYEMGRVSLDFALAKWAIMLSLGIALVLFVALNEKKGIVAAMRGYYDQARLWE